MEDVISDDWSLTAYIDRHLQDVLIKTDTSDGKLEAELLQSFTESLYSVASEKKVQDKLEEFIKTHIDSMYEEGSGAGQGVYDSNEEREDVTVMSQYMDPNEGIEVYNRTMSQKPSSTQQKLDEGNQGIHHYGENDFMDEYGSVPSSTTGINLRSYDMRLMYAPIMAVLLNDLCIIELCIGTGFDMNLFRGGRYSLLFMAVKHPKMNLNVISLLLKHMDLKQKINGDSLLHVVVRHSMTGHDKLQLINTLIDAGADCNVEDSLGDNVLCAYISVLRYDFEPECWQDTLDVLIKASDKILDSKNKLGLSALHKMVTIFPSSNDKSNSTAFPDVHTHKSNNTVVSDVHSDKSNSTEESDAPKVMNTDEENCIKIVNYLIAKGSDLATTDYSGFTLVHSAVTTHNIALVNLLIGKGCSVHELSNQGHNPIFTLCSSSHAEFFATGETSMMMPILQCLVDAGCCVNRPALNGSTALHYAAAFLPAIVCKYLISVGADVHARDCLDDTPLHSATMNTDIDALQHACQGVHCVNILNRYLQTPFHYACHFGNLPAMEYLLEKETDVSARAHFGLQPIHIASERFHGEVIEMLLKAGASKNARDMWNSTPLHYAIFARNINSAECLIASGADQNILNDAQQTPLDVAIATGHYDITQVLTGDKINIEDLIPFPIGMPIPQKYLKQHYNNLEKKFLKIGNCGQIVQEIISLPILQRVKFHCSENQVIKEQVERLVCSLIIKMEDLDKRFKGIIIKSGSVYEGVKIRYPNEFDFMVNLSKFSKCLQQLNHFGDGFVGVKVENNIEENFHEFMTQDGCYDSAKIFRKFKQLLLVASWAVLPSFPWFQFSLPNVHGEAPCFNETSQHEGQLLTFTVGWKGAVYKNLEIAMDINPVIYCKSWPHYALQTSNIVSDLSSKGIYLIPKQVKDYRTQPNSIITSPESWRISFSHIELEFFSNISEELKDIYSVIKSFLFEPLNPQIIPLCPSDCDGQSSKDEEESPGRFKTITLGDLFKKEILKKQRYRDSFDKMIEEQSSTCDITDTPIELCTYVPTYYVKQIFFKKLESMIASGKLTYEQIRTASNPETITVYRTLLLNVYKDLLVAVENTELTSYFLPQKQMISPFDVDNDYEVGLQVPDLIPKFVRCIVDLLKNTGFESP